MAIHKKVLSNQPLAGQMEGKGNKNH